MAAASGLSETMILDDDSGAHEGSDDDNGDDGYGIESHGEQAAIARQVRLLLDLDRLGQIIAATSLMESSIISVILRRSR